MKKHPKKEKGSLWAGWLGLFLERPTTHVWSGLEEKKKKEVRIKGTTRRASGLHNCGLVQGQVWLDDTKGSLSTPSFPTTEVPVTPVTPLEQTIADHGEPLQTTTLLLLLYSAPSSDLAGINSVVVCTTLPPAFSHPPSVLARHHRLPHPISTRPNPGWRS